MDKLPILLSVVAQYNNDDLSAQTMLETLAAQVKDLVSDYEIIIVDNGSNDAGFDAIEALLKPGGVGNVQLYRLVRRVEEGVATWAGVENSLGDYVLVLDPRRDGLGGLKAGLDEISRGRDVVYFRNTIAPRRGAFENLMRGAFRMLFQQTTGIDLRIDALSQRIISKRVISYLLQQPHPGLRYRTLPSLAGFSKATVTYSEKPAGGGHMPGLISRARAGLRLLLATTTAPLRLVSAAAFAGGAFNAVYSLYVVFIYLFKADVAPGWTTLSLQQSTMFFLISLVLFISTEYLVQIIRQTSNGPLYFLTHDATSAVLTRRERLNVETARPRAFTPADLAN